MYKIIDKRSNYNRIEYLVEITPEYNLSDRELLEKIDNPVFGGYVSRVSDNKLRAIIYID